MFSLFNKKKICKHPFEQVFILYNGDVWLCCDVFWKEPCVIGNILESSFEEIWNSEKAKNIRKKMLKQDYSLCHYNGCHDKFNISSLQFSYLSDKKIKHKPHMDSYPRLVNFNSDCECNVRCVTCRDEIYRLSDAELKAQNERIEKIYLPILKDAEMVTLNGSGELFASRHSRLLIKSIISRYPKIRFNLLTNALLCDQYNCDRLELTDRIESIAVSLHAATKQTYQKMVLDSNYDKVLENLNWIKENVDKGKIKKLFFVFVVTSLNYKEMPEFVEFAKKYNADAYFWGCSDWGNVLKNSHSFLSVSTPNHPEFNEFLKVLKSCDFSQSHAHFGSYYTHLYNMVKSSNIL